MRKLAGKQRQQCLPSLETGTECGRDHGGEDYGQSRDLK